MSRYQDGKLLYQDLNFGIDCDSRVAIVGPNGKPLHPTPYTLHPTPYTLHPTPYTLHPHLQKPKR